MRLVDSFAPLRRPMGLAARAALFTSLLLAVTAALSAAMLVFGAQRESRHQQLGITRQLVMHMATGAGEMMADGDTHSMHLMVDQTSVREEVRRLSVRDASNRVLAEGGGDAAEAAVVDQLALRVLQTQEIEYQRSADGGLALGAPVLRDGQLVGVALIMWDSTAYRFAAFSGLAPFLLILACVGLVAIPLTSYFVRRAISPLDQLARFAEKIAENEEPAMNAENVVELESPDLAEQVAAYIDEIRVLYPEVELEPAAKDEATSGSSRARS
jgi:hypothetical protein